MNAENFQASDDRCAWFRDARFGMFLHWGLYSLLGRGEWVMKLDGIPRAEYERLAARWRPRPCFAAEWAALAKAAGMGYMVLTTKHHDGFCLFDSRFTSYNAVHRTPGRRDLVGEYVEACRASGLRVGLYYSIGDWRSPLHRAVLGGQAGKCAALQRFIHGQVRELLTRYGKIDMLWYDGAFYDGKLFTAESMAAAELNAMARSLQPGILINPRAGVPGDFDTCENELHASPPGRDWEMCTCINDMWGYCRHDYNYKSYNQILFLLASCACQGGNLLLNVSPMPDGTIPAPQAARLRKVGRWLKLHGEAIRGTERLQNPYSGSGRRTKKNGKLYYHVFYWPGTEMIVADLDDATLGGTVGKTAVQAWILSNGCRLTARWQGRRLILSGLPEAPPDNADTVIVVEVNGPSPGGKDLRPESYLTRLGTRVSRD